MMAASLPGEFRPSGRSRLLLLVQRVRWAWELSRQWRSADPLTIAGLLGGAMFLGGGILLLVLRAALDVLATGSRSLVVAGVLVTLGAVGLFVPWARCSRRWQLAYPIVGLVCASQLAHDARTGVAVAAAVVTLLFVVAGFSQPVGTAFLLAPGAWIVLWSASSAPHTASYLTEIALELAVAVIAGEAVAVVLQSRQRNEARIQLVLDAVRELATVRDQADGANRVVRLASSLLNADLAAVYLADADANPDPDADSPESTEFPAVVTVGHPALIGALPTSIDEAMLQPDGGTRVEGTAVIGDCSLVLDCDARVRGRIRAVVALPIAEEAGTLFGAVVLGFARSRAPMSRAARGAAMILGEQTTTMFRRVRSEHRLTVAASTDPLTELANRRTFDAALARLHPGDAVVLVDLDRFKSVNDRFGHAAGDATLRELARCLRSVARQADVVARYGGEEFAIVMPDGGDDGARAVLARLRHAWADPPQLTTFSSGVAVHRMGESALDTIARADDALYQAKDLGRNRDAFADGVVALS